MARLRFLLDSNILSEPARKAPDSEVLALIAEHQELICTAAPVLHEMHYGVARLAESQRKLELTRYLQQVINQLDILPYDRESAVWHAEQRVSLSTKGRPPPFVDGQIAAIAATNNLVLVTRNVDDFHGFEGLDVDNWFKD